VELYKKKGPGGLVVGWISKKRGIRRRTANIISRGINRAHVNAQRAAPWPSEGGRYAGKRIGGKIWAQLPIEFHKLFDKKRREKKKGRSHKDTAVKASQTGGSHITGPLEESPHQGLKPCHKELEDQGNEYSALPPKQTWGTLCFN